MVKHADETQYVPQSCKMEFGKGIIRQPSRTVKELTKMGDGRGIDLANLGIFVRYNLRSCSGRFALGGQGEDVAEW